MAKTKRTKRRTTTSRRAAPRRKRTAKKARTTPKRIPNTTVRSSGANTHHQVMRMPFSVATSQPKIPDGKVASSLSRRLQKVCQLHNAAGEDTLHIVMVPSLGVCGAVYGSDDDKGARSFSPIGFSGQTVGLQGGEIGDQGKVKNLSGISHWRIVSQAMKFQLNATEEENDG